MNNKKYIIISGEYSGDIYGSMLIRELKQLNDNSQFWGVGGENMKNQNVTMLADMKDLSIIGFTASILKIKKLKQIMENICLEIKKINPDHIILIDFPGFNLSLAKKIKKNSNVPISFFISPTIWAWGSKRINYVKQFIDQMLVIFPFEENYYKERGYNQVKFVGHPFFDRIQKYNKEEIKNELGIDGHLPFIGLFPGSRMTELEKHMPIFLKSVNTLLKKDPKYQFGIGLSSNFNKSDFKNQFKINDNIMIYSGDPFKLLMCSDITIATSGTITLESSFMLTPCIVVYKLSFISWLLAKCLLKTEYISMTNILLNKPLLKEFVQYNATPQKIVNSILLYMQNKKEIEEELKEVLEIYNNGHNAIQNASELIYNYE